MSAVHGEFYFYHVKGFLMVIGKQNGKVTSRGSGLYQQNTL